MAFKKIPARSNLAPQVHKQLRRAIVRGALPPGTRLVETKIAEELGVSRTPVREAISQLVAQGFVKEEMAGARVVADMEVEIHDLFDVRELLEGFAARLAAVRASDEELQEIDNLSRASMRAVSSASVAERAALNNLFHGSVAKASQSNRLIKIIGEFCEYAITEEMLPFFGEEGTRGHVAEHAEVVDALKRRDATAAEAAMKKHIRGVMKTVNLAIRGVRDQTIALDAFDAIDELDLGRVIETFK